MGVRIGIIGYGGFGRFLHQSWSALDEVEVVAVSDEKDPGTLLAGGQYYPNWRDLIKAREVDIVSIATPPFWHSRMACEAMEAGKHVLIEKPLATTLKDAERILATRDRTGCHAAIDYVLRHNPIVKWITSCVESQTFGRLKHVSVENFAQDETLPPEHWFWDRDLSGGILVEHGVHFLDLTNQWACSTPSTVQILSHQRPDGRVDRVLAAIQYRSGVMTTQLHSFDRPRSFERTTIHITFDLADIFLRGWIPLQGSIVALVNERSERTLGNLPGFSETDGRKLGPSPGAYRIFSGGTPYEVQRQLSGTFSINETKEQVYASGVQAVLSDLIACVSGHKRLPVTTLEDGFSSLSLALGHY